MQFVLRLGPFLITCLWLVGCVSPSLSGGIPQSSDSDTQTASPTAGVVVEVTAQESVISASTTPEAIITSPPLEATPSPTAEIDTKVPATVPTRPSPIPTEEIPYPPPTLAPEPTLPFGQLETIINAEYGVTWGVPQGWWEVSEQVVPPSIETLYWRTWSDQEGSAAIFSQPPAGFPAGLMMLKLEVEPEGVSPFPPPDSRPREIASGGYYLEVQEYEVTSLEAAPFTLRLGFAVMRSPYRYNLVLSCLPPANGDVTQYDDLCRRTWNFVFFAFALCPLPSTLPGISMDSWRQIRNNDYDYSFEVLTSLSELRGHPQRLLFLSDPAAYNPPLDCPLPDGLMRFDFAADPPSEFGSNNRPDVEGYTETAVGDLPAWIRTTVGGEGLQPLDTYTELYIQGPKFWYTMRWVCRTPTDSSEEDQAEFVQQCQAVLERILGSFQVMSP